MTRPAHLLPRLLLILMLLSVAGTALAHNPFVSRDDGPTKPDQPSQTDQRVQEEQQPPAAGFLRRISGRLLPLQRELHARLAKTIRAYKAEGADASRVLALLLGSFLYGLVHAVGPGHGKSVASAYFLAKGGRRRHGLYMGMTTGAVHATSAVVTVLLLRLLMEGAVSTGFESTVDRISQISFLAIAAIGMVMLALAVREMLVKKDVQPEETALPGDRQYLKVAVISGLIPCPGAAIILFFTLALKVPLLGVASVAAMSMGMGLTISAAAVLTLQCRTSLLSASQKRSGTWRVLRHVLSVLGALLVIALGLFFAWISFLG